MPICIECSYPVSQLYHVLHSRSHKKPPPVPPKPAPASLSKKTGSKSTGSLRGLQESVKASLRSEAKTSEEAEARKNERRGKRSKGGGVGSDVRLTQCPRCKRFADKYVEHDFVVLFIDLVLVKPQVYRHLLFNRLHRDDDELDPSILRLGTLLLLFDVYITWSHIESLSSDLTSRSKITNLAVLLQYCFFLFLCLATTLSQHLTVRWLAGWVGLGSSGGTDSGSSSTQGSPNVGLNSSAEAPTSAPLAAPRKRPTPNAISTALFVSSCMSLFPLLMVVWKYGDSSTTLNAATPPALHSSSAMSFATGLLAPFVGRGVDWVREGVSWIVAYQNLEALRILLGCGYLGAGGLVLAGRVVRWIVRATILGVVGLGEAG